MKTFVNQLKKTDCFNVLPSAKKYALSQFVRKNVYSILQVSPSGFLVYTNHEDYPVQDWEVLTREERESNPSGVRELTEFDGMSSFQGKEYYCFRNN